MKDETDLDIEKRVQVENVGHLDRGEEWIIRLTSWFRYETACRGVCVCVCVCVGVYNLLARSPAPLLPPDLATIISAQITREPSVLLPSLLLLTEGARRILLEHVRPRHSFTPRKAFVQASLVKNLPANAGDTSSIPGPERFHLPWGN